MTVGMLERWVTGLFGVAFAIRILDSSKPWWARAGYGLVGYDLLTTAWNDKSIFAGAQSSGLISRPSNGDVLKFAEVRVSSIDERVAKVHEQMLQGTRDPVVYGLAREVLSKKCGDGWCVPQKNPQAEIEAMFFEVKKRVRYTWDPLDYDAFQTPAKTLHIRNGDCVPADSLVVTKGYGLKPIGEVVVGDTILGDGKWTKVTQFYEKGEKKLLALDLDNGCTLRCTKDHRVFVVTPDGQEHEKRAGHVRVGEKLLAPKNLPEGVEDMDPDRAWLLGTYIAMSGTGVGARNKQVPPAAMMLAPLARTALLEGLAADAAHEGKNKSYLVYGTISPTLALQLRLLYRQAGTSVNIRRMVDHGGLGTNPIYRVTVRKNDKKSNPKVRAIRELPAERVVDIETDSHRFYLPEADVTVHNCDDMWSLLGAMLRSIGHKVRSRVVRTSGNATWNHIYGLVQLSGTNQWMPLDLTVEQPPGWEVPKQYVQEVKDFDVVEKGEEAARALPSATTTSAPIPEQP